MMKSRESFFSLAFSAKCPTLFSQCPNPNLFTQCPNLLSPMSKPLHPMSKPFQPMSKPFQPMSKPLALSATKPSANRWDDKTAETHEKEESDRDNDGNMLSCYIPRRENVGLSFPRSLVVLILDWDTLDDLCRARGKRQMQEEDHGKRHWDTLTRGIGTLWQEALGHSGKGHWNTLVRRIETLW